MEKIYKNTEYSTKTTNLGKAGIGCRIFRNDKLIDETIVEDKSEIGKAFKEMFRMIDKCGGGDKFTHSVRHRIKTFRGFHGSVNSANIIMKGFEVHYNFIRPHLALKGKTPSELATDIKLNNPNKWLSLIDLSKA